MFKVICTLDYEIHGNGDGSPNKLMVKPTERIINLFSTYGAKLTIFADVAEILKFKEYYEQYGEDHFNYMQIIEQLKNAAKKGHDVQLHLHPSYFNAKYINNKWEQYWDEYNLAELSCEEIEKYIRRCKLFLEEIIKPVNSNYKCNVFRAANWCMMPSQNIVTALIKNGFIIDSSVYKYGVGRGIVNYDYSSAPDELQPWFIDKLNINKKNKFGSLLEAPIYCEKKHLWHFITPLRIFRMIRAKYHKHEDTGKLNDRNLNTGIWNYFGRKIKYFSAMYPWKMDINQSTGYQLIHACRRIEKKYKPVAVDLPIVLTGHSKTFVKMNTLLLRPFLKYIQKNNNYKFALYNEIRRETFRYT
jgi:hypothetical protein